MAFWSVVATAIVMFATTNIDDALVLVVFFANAAEGRDGMKKRHVWIGQTVGFTLIMALTLIGTAVGSFLPPHYTGLLGFVPMLMGFWRMRVWCKKDKNEDETKAATQVKETEYSDDADVEVGLPSRGIGDSSAQYQDLETPKALTNSPSSATKADVEAGHSPSGIRASSNQHQDVEPLNLSQTQH